MGTLFRGLKFLGIPETPRPEDGTTPLFVTLVGLVWAPRRDSGFRVYRV